MTEFPRELPSTPAIQEAVDWLVRCDAGNMTSEERAAFERWLAADPTHPAAYAEVERIWSDADHIAVPPVTSAPTKSKHRSLRRAFAAAIGMCLLVIVAWQLDVVSRLQADAMTGVGEIRSITLADGSRVDLNTDSAIAVSYSEGERKVRLLRGEAGFDVVRDTARPFRVEADGGSSTAVGTAYIVRRRPDDVVVTVLDGKVDVARSGREANLIAGEQVVYSSALGVGSIHRIDPSAIGAWRRGKLVFVDLPLGDVIDELNRYYVGFLRLSDESLRSRRVTGVFEIGDPVAIVNALEKTLGLRSTRFAGFVILLHL